MALVDTRPKTARATMLSVIIVNFLFAFIGASDMEDERMLAKPWYVRDIAIGGVSLYISPVGLAAIVYGVYTLVNVFVDHTFCEASHILMTSEDAEKKLKDVKKQIKNDPAKFAEAAAKHSTCPSGKEGGMLGKFKRNVMAPPFDRAAFDRKNEVGTVIGPVQTTFGWHLILIHRRRIE